MLCRQAESIRSSCGLSGVGAFERVERGQGQCVARVPGDVGRSDVELRTGCRGEAGLPRRPKLSGTSPSSAIVGANEAGPRASLQSSRHNAFERAISARGRWRRAVDGWGPSLRAPMVCLLVTGGLEVATYGL